MLLDTGAPRSICTETWLEELNWIPNKKIALPEDIPPFKFAEHPVKALYGACFNALITDLRGKPHNIRLCVAGYANPLHCRTLRPAPPCI